MPAIVSRPFLQVIGAAVLAVTFSVARYPPGPSISAHGIVGDWCSVSRVPALLGQLKDPFVGLNPEWPLAENGEQGNLFNATRWRILPPLLAHLLGLSPTLFLTLPMLGSCLLVAVAAHYAQLNTSHGGITALVAVLTATSSAFFVSADWIQFDAIYIIALLVFTFSPNSVALWAACCLGPWVDERFLLILPACVFLRYARTGRLPFTLAILGIAPYALVRLLAACLGDGSLVYQLRLQNALLSSYLPRVPLGWWMGFRAAWPLIGVGAAAAWFALPRKAKILYCLALGVGLAAVVFLACDISRSIALLLPFLVSGACAKIRWPFSRGLGSGLALMAILNLVLPASHILLKARIPIGQWEYQVHLPPPAP